MSRRSVLQLGAGIVCALVLAWGCAAETAVPTPPPSPTVSNSPRVAFTTGVVYATPLDAGASEWMLDVYAPIVEATGPVVVFAHGLGGNRTGYVELGEALAERGAVVFMVDWPDILEDMALREDGRGTREMMESLACAVRFASARAPEYGGDPQRMVVGGHSYAGPVSAWTALVGEDMDEVWEGFATRRGGPPAQLKCTEEVEAARAIGHISVGGAYNIWAIDRYWEQDRELMELVDVYSQLGRNPQLRVALILGELDGDMRAHVHAFEKAVAESGYEVELLSWDGKHAVPADLTAATAIELAGATGEAAP
jgi:acetyl esterase/lipase